MEPLVSIVFPVYNVYPYIRESIDSIIGQTYKNLEIIIVDDGSSDGSSDICEEYAAKDPRIRFIRQANKGVSAARNVGLDEFTGDYLAFLDSDDVFEKEFVEKAVASIISEDVDMVVCKSATYVTTEKLGSSDPVDIVPVTEPGVYDRDYVIQSLFDETFKVIVWNKLYKRELWDGIRFPDGHVFEDVEIMYRLCCKCSKVSILPGVLHLHRKRPNSITTLYTKNSIDDAILAALRTEDFVRQNTPDIFSEEQLQQFDHRIVKRLIVHYLQSKNIKDEGKKEYRKNLRNRIFEAGKKYGTDYLSFHVKVAYNMVRICPWLLDLIYPCMINIFR